MSVNSANTIGDYLDGFKRQSFIMSQSFLQELLKDNTVKEFHNEENLVNQHNSYIDEIKVKYTMTNEEYRKYKCNPWRMAHDLYENSELWFILLHANEMYSATEFTRKTVYIYKDEIVSRLTEIRSARSDIVKINENEIFLSKKEIIEGNDGMWD